MAGAEKVRAGGSSQVTLVNYVPDAALTDAAGAERTKASFYFRRLRYLLIYGRPPRIARDCWTPRLSRLPVRLYVVHFEVEFTPFETFSLRLKSPNPNNATMKDPAPVGFPEHVNRLPKHFQNVLRSPLKKRYKVHKREVP
jgi:hypothetical protein